MQATLSAMPGQSGGAAKLVPEVMKIVATRILPRRGELCPLSCDIALLL
jgi:hypothetical protein